MNSREALRDKRDGSIFVLVEIQSTDEPARLVGGLDLDLYVALHVSLCCKFGSFIAIRLDFSDALRVVRGARIPLGR